MHVSPFTLHSICMYLTSMVTLKKSQVVILLIRLIKMHLPSISEIMTP